MSSLETAYDNREDPEVHLTVSFAIQPIYDAGALGAEFKRDWCQVLRSFGHDNAAYTGTP